MKVFNKYNNYELSDCVCKAMETAIVQENHQEVIGSWVVRIVVGLTLGVFSYFAHFRIPKFPASLYMHLAFIAFYLGYSYYYEWTAYVQKQYGHAGRQYFIKGKKIRPVVQFKLHSNNYELSLRTSRSHKLSTHQIDIYTVFDQKGHLDQPKIKQITHKLLQGMTN